MGVGAHEFLVQRLGQIVYTFRGPERWLHPLDPVAALDELQAWVSDDHQWTDEQRANWPNWDSLLQDVLLTWRELPYTVKQRTREQSTAALEIVRAARKQLQREKRNALNERLRQALRQAEAGLGLALADPGLLQAAWTDLVRAVRNGSVERERAALALLSVLSEFQDRPWQPLSRRLWQILGDDAGAIASAKAAVAGEPESVDGGPPQRADLTAADRLELAARVIGLPVHPTDVVVWLAYAPADVSPMVVSLGQDVTVFCGQWLTAVVEAGNSAPETNRNVLPAEVVQHPEVFRYAWHTEGDPFPFVLVRIDLGQALVAHSLRQAQETMEALLRLAAFYNRGRSIWRYLDSYVVVADGNPGWHTAGLERDPLEARHAPHLVYDKTVSSLVQLAPTLGPHLPVRDAKVAETLELLRWLTEARHTWTPATLLLSARVLEKVASWAGYEQWPSFAREQLAPRWAFGRLTDEIAATGRAAVNGIDYGGGMTPVVPSRRAQYLEAIGPRGILDASDIDRAIHVPNVLEHLQWLGSVQAPGSEGALRVASLRHRLRDGRSALRWWLELEQQFELMLERMKRTRNSLVHGGPLAQQTIATLAQFVDEIASDALNHTLDAHLRGQSAHSVFAQRQKELEQTRSSLAAGAPVRDSLFPAGPTL